MIKRLIDQISVLIFSIPWVKSLWSKHFATIESNTIPWAPLIKPLSECKMALMTSGSVHLKNDLPFNMDDKNGDPTFRKIPSSTTHDKLMITHKYYNHQDADKDINIVLPLDRLKEIQHIGYVGSSSKYFYSFMGHIDKNHIKTLVEKTAKEVAKRLKKEQGDIVLLVPA